MRSLLLAVVLVSWACAEGVAPPRQFDKAADANLARPDAQTVALTPPHMKNRLQALSTDGRGLEGDSCD